MDLDQNFQDGVLPYLFRSVSSPARWHHIPPQAVAESRNRLWRSLPEAQHPIVYCPAGERNPCAAADPPPLPHRPADPFAGSTSRQSARALPCLSTHRIGGRRPRGPLRMSASPKLSTTLPLYSYRRPRDMVDDDVQEHPPGLYCFAGAGADLDLPGAEGTPAGRRTLRFNTMDMHSRIS